MDRETLLDTLQNSTTLTKRLVRSLKALRRELEHFDLDGQTLPVFTEQLLERVVPLTCEDMLRASKDEPREVTDECQEQLFLLLQALAGRNELACEKIVDLFLMHIEAHSSCTNSFVTILKLLLRCELTRTALKESDFASAVVASLELSCAQAQQPPQPAESAQKHSRHASEVMLKNRTSSFRPNLVPAEYRTTLREAEGEGIQREFPTLHGHTVKSRALRRAALEKTDEHRQFVVPALNLGEGTSSRRNDVQKSASFRSGHMSGSWGDNAPSPLVSSPFGKDSKLNFSQLHEFEASFVAEDNLYHEKGSPSKVMCNLAMHLGEACLTADLTALIAQKRDSDLEKIAKLAALPGRNLALESRKEKKPRLVPLKRFNSFTSVQTAQKGKQRPLLITDKVDVAHTHKLRSAILSLLYYLLLLYEPAEIQYVRSPLNIIFGHILSTEYGRLQSVLTLTSQETGEFSDDEQELYEEELNCVGEESEDIPDFVNLKHFKEELGQIPNYTVPGVSPRGARGVQEVEDQSFLNESLWMLAHDSSQLKNPPGNKNILLSEYAAVFSILRIYGLYTENIHRQAVTSIIPTVLPLSSSSHLFEGISPKRPRMRSPNVSLAFSMTFEDPYQQRENAFWVHGVKHIEGFNKERLRKTSDTILYRFHKRLQWAQEDLRGPALCEYEGDLYLHISKYLRVCRTRITFFQAVDLLFEQLLSTKKRIIDGMETPLPGFRHQFANFLQVLSQLMTQACTPEAFKLLCDIFIANEVWQDCCRVFALSLLPEAMRPEARPVVKYYNASAIMLRKVVNELQLDRRGNELTAHERTWRDNVRKALRSLTWLVAPESGVLPRYLHKYAPDTGISVSNYSPPPRNLYITTAVLELLINLYWFSARFTSFRSADYALYYIRMHYISFLKLYTLNKPKEVSREPGLNMTMGNASEVSVMADVQNSAYLKSCLTLCKLHLKCMFAYARNRTADVTRKFYQFRILEFLTREIDLEYDITLRREKFIQLHKAEKARVTQKFSKKTEKIIEKPPEKPVERKPSLNLNLNLLRKEETVESVQSPSPAPILKLPIPDAKKPAIPALKIGFLTQDPDKKEQEKKEFVKALVEDDILQPNFELTKIQNSLDGTNKFQLALEANAAVSNDDLLASQEICKEAEFYDQERRQREIYSDTELQTLMIGLLFCLLLTPTRGCLEELYCSQYPINNGKPNVLFLLHHHLNHAQNKKILPGLLKLVAHIVPPLAGQRLLKLLCGAFFDSSRFQGWEKIAVGAYGTVYECSTGLAEPETVAIKKMSVPKSIYDRCVLHDIFTEIACLEEFRMEKCITDLYDYGLDENDYYIVMKKYKISLKEWRQSLPGAMEDHLPMILTLFREVVKAVQIIHSHNTTHYDLKCDNVLLEEPIEDCQVTIGDFGECRMFVNSEDEICLRNKGTEYIKSPEMLELTKKVKKDHDQYDRRKKIGTSRASDIWSLGCLFYELLTGEFLFYHQDWVHFYIRCTFQDEELLTDEKLQKINMNVYLVDFLKYMLIRDPRHRPSIDNVRKRFEHLHALLVSATRFTTRQPIGDNMAGYSEFEGMVDQCVTLMSSNTSMKDFSGTPQPSFLKITHDIHLCSSGFLRDNSSWLMQIGITHVVYSEADECALRKFQSLMVGPMPLQSLAGVLDFIRAAHVNKGSILFVEHEDLGIRETILMSLSAIFYTNCYETWTLVNSQTLFFDMPMDILLKLSIWTLNQSQIRNYLSRFPRYQCLCGSCTLILKRHLVDPKNQIVKHCNCSRQYRNIDTSDCPSPGCGDFLQTIKDLYGLSWDSLKWGLAEKDDFFIGHLGMKKQEEQAILNSMNLEGNAELLRVIEKKPWRSGTEQWALFACKNCFMWIYAVSNDDNKVAYLMNIDMTGKNEGIILDRDDLRVPVLSKVKLPLIIEQKGNEMVRPNIKYARSFVPTAKTNVQILT